MITRIKSHISKYSGKLYYTPQIKLHWYSRWQNLDTWLGNYGERIIDGQKVMMFTDYRITTGSIDLNCDTKEEAQEYIDNLKKQGYLYEPRGIWDIYPVFNDGFKGFCNE